MMHLSCGCSRKPLFLNVEEEPAAGFPGKLCLRASLVKARSVGRRASSVSTCLSVSHQRPAAQDVQHLRPRAVEPVPSESVTNVRTKWSAAPRWRDTRWTNWHIKAKWQQHEPHHGEGTSDKKQPIRSELFPTSLTALTFLDELRCMTWYLLPPLFLAILQESKESFSHHDIQHHSSCLALLGGTEVNKYIACAWHLMNCEWDMNCEDLSLQSWLNVV